MIISQLHKPAIMLTVTPVNLFENLTEAPYGEKMVSYPFADKDIFVISDLHIAAGLNKNGNYTGNENFFADNSFQRFTDRLIYNYAGESALLVINGDLVDFLRIGEIPETEADFLQWNEILGKIGINKTVGELRGSIVAKERKYGLKTDDYKSVWRLYLCSRGHKLVFDSLAKWLLNGHKLVIVKGNHDLEWFWKAVRDCMRLLLAERISLMNNLSTQTALTHIVIPGLTFIDDNFTIGGNIYIEHGHRYENFTKVYGPAVLENETELNLPFGSFFNRYLVNRIELAYPFIDDVRPRENILPVLIQERFPLAIKLLFNYVPLVLLVIPKRQYKYALKYLFQFLLIAGIPILVAAYVFIKLVSGSSGTASNSSFFIQLLISAAKSAGVLILSYFLSRLFAMLKLTPPDGLYKNAQTIFHEHPQIQVVTMGHTHNPQQMDNVHQTKRYYNTGTWIPVFETDAADIRIDKTYTYLHLELTGPNVIAQTCLMRWNDDAERADEMILLERK